MRGWPIGIGSVPHGTPPPTPPDVRITYPASRLVRPDATFCDTGRGIRNRTLQTPQPYGRNESTSTMYLLPTTIYPATRLGHRSGLRRGESSPLSGFLPLRGSFPPATMPFDDFRCVIGSPLGSLSPRTGHATDLPGYSRQPSMRNRQIYTARPHGG